MDEKPADHYVCYCRLKCGEKGVLVHRATYFRHQKAEKALVAEEELEEYQRQHHMIQQEMGVDVPIVNEVGGHTTQEQHTEETFLPEDHPMADVEDEIHAVPVESQAAGLGTPAASEASVPVEKLSSLNDEAVRRYHTIVIAGSTERTAGQVDHLDNESEVQPPPGFTIEEGEQDPDNVENVGSDDEDSDADSVDPPPSLPYDDAESSPDDDDDSDVPEETNIPFSIPPHNDLPPSKIKHVALAQEFARRVSEATLENGKLPPHTLHRLHNPHLPLPSIDDPQIRTSIDIYLALSKSSREAYHNVQKALATRNPPIHLLSYHSVVQVIADLTGVVEIEDDMCIKGCLAYTGPFEDDTTCHYCKEPRYDQAILAKTGKSVARMTMTTIPLGPQIQARRRSPESAEAMLYQSAKVKQILASIEKETTEADRASRRYDDVFCGEDYLKLHQSMNIGPNDTTLVISFDGAQIYRDKKSDCQIGTATLYNFEPSLRYKVENILPAFVFGSPSNKPKCYESFFFRTFHHLSAIQRANGGAGLKFYCGKSKSVEMTRVFCLHATADAVAIVDIDGKVGHHGAQGCRMSCPLKGRHKAGVGHYYPVHLTPHDADGQPIDTQQDFQIRNVQLLQSCPPVERYTNNLRTVVSSPTASDYIKKRKETGISKPSILSGLRPDLIYPIPRCFTVDLMHLFGLNVGEVLIKLYTGGLACAATDSKTTWVWATLMDTDTWKAHGQTVANALRYFPSSFHRPPRNPAEKINSGYKATEWSLYIFCLGPAVMRTVLPHIFWRHFCRLVRGTRILFQREITAAQADEAKINLMMFVEDFERLFYQRRKDRIHFCRQSIHTLLHAPFEPERVGPGCYLSQYTLERAIGVLGGDIRLHSNPYSNLSQVAVRLAQTNALKAMHPEFSSTLGNDKIPRYSQPLGNGYIFLRPRDRRPPLVDEFGARVGTLLKDTVGIAKVRRWGRMGLPNGQIVRSSFSEERRTSPHYRISRNIKIKSDTNSFEYGEVKFFFFAESPEDPSTLHPYALVVLYSAPHPTLLEDSFSTLYACKHLGEQGLHIIPVDRILSVVSMQPLPYDPIREPQYEGLWFVGEKLGLDDIQLGEVAEPLDHRRSDEGGDGSGANV